MKYGPLFYIADQREALRLGKPLELEWMRKYHLPNVDRNRDRTTMWIKQNIVKPLWKTPRLARALTVARSINKLELLVTLHPVLVEPMSFTRFGKLLSRVLTPYGRQLTSPTYRVRPIPGVSAVDSILARASALDEDQSFLGCPYLETMHRKISILPFFGSDLNEGTMAYNMVLDLIGDIAPDRATWAAPSELAWQGLRAFNELPPTPRPIRQQRAFAEAALEIQMEGGMARGWWAAEIERALYLFARSMVLANPNKHSRERLYANGPI